MPKYLSPSPLDFDQLRKRVQEADGNGYWRSLEELAGTQEFRSAMEREFPSLMERWNDGASRRTLLKLMGASLALMGLSGCFYKKPQGKIVPSPKKPDETVTGQPLFFATAMPFDGYGRGVLALSREGRPTKIEGNPSHPASLGGTDVFMQASILDLYDPDRSRTVMHSGRTATWGDLVGRVRERLSAARKEGVRLLTGTVTSPTLLRQIQAFSKQLGGVWHEYCPMRLPHGGEYAGAFAEPVEMILDPSKAEVIVSFGCDFLFKLPGSVRYARQFIDGRRVREDHKEMNRLYVAESTMTLTGSMADHRLAARPSRMETLAVALARRLGAQVPFEAASTRLSEEEQRWIEAMQGDLTHGGSGKGTLVVAGQFSPALEAVVHAINQKLGNVGRSVSYIDPVAGSGARGLRELVDDLQAGKVDALFILGGNPAYDAPSDVAFGPALEAFSKQMRGDDYAGLTVHLGTHYDETSYRCQWHVPQTHYLEAWGDVRAFDGTASIIQPLIAPLFGSWSAWELMEMLLGRPDRLGIEIVQETWRKQAGDDFGKWWMESLQMGVIGKTASRPREAPAIRTGIAPTPAPREKEIEIVFEPDPCVWTGRFANNAWLQELPKPFIKLTWDNAIAMSVRMAEELGGAEGPLRDGRMVRLEYRGRSIEGPVMLLPGQAAGIVAVTLGYGRSEGGAVLREEEGPRGYDAYRLRTSRSPWHGAGVKITVLEGHAPLAVTRNHHAMSTHAGVPGLRPELKPETIAVPADSDMDLEVKNRKIIRAASLGEYRKSSEVIKDLDPEGKKPLLSLYPGWDYNHGLQWGMSIDQTACIGCNACVVACVAENNIAVVGKREVMRQREMHWIRIDDYFGGELDSPTVYHQPVPCMHCENAPCEYVCPVGATTHSDEGLNEMTYNRCIGTRYCSNNCPYKVRRFNFLLYSDYQTPTLKLLHNPDVTVRSRGVMEKCTYCVQRIDNTRVEMEHRQMALREAAARAEDAGEKKRLLAEAEERGREVVRGLQTACQQACPTRAIIFGDIRDEGSDVAKLKKEPADYGLLTELTTKPRTTYLARFTNPNPAFGKGAAT